MLISCDPSSGSSVDSSPESFDSTGQWLGRYVGEDETDEEEYSLFFDINCTYPDRFLFLPASPGSVEIDDETHVISITGTKDAFKDGAISYEKSKEGDLTVISCPDYGSVIKYKVVDNDTIECGVYDVGHEEPYASLILTRIDETYEIKFVSSEGPGASD